MAQNRANVDHQRRLAGLQQWQRRADQLDRGEKIDFHDLPQSIGRRLGKATERTHPGIVDHQVEPAEALRGRRYGASAHGRVGNIAGQDLNLPWAIL